MSTLTDIRHFLKQYVENDKARSIISFLTYQNIQRYKNEDNLSERMEVVKQIDGETLILDNEFGEYFLHCKDGNIFVGDTLVELEEKMKERKR